MKQFVLKDNEGYEIIVVNIIKIDKAWIEGEALITTAWNEGIAEDFDFFADFYIKWDGCSHFYFKGQDNDDSGYYHICGGSDYITHIEVLAFINKIAIDIIPGYDEYHANFKIVQNLKLLDGYKIIEREI